MSRYNGWANYETWRVNLEIFDGITARDLTGLHVPPIVDIKESAKEYAQQLIESTSPEGFARDYALAFLDAVEWWEIANRLAADLEESNEEEEQEA